MSVSQINIKKMYWISLFSGFNLLEPVLTFFYLSLGLSLTKILFVLMCFSVSVLIFEVPTGVFADRFGAKKSFLFGCIVKLISLALLLFAKNEWYIYASQVLSGLSATFFSGALEALLFESLKRDNREDEMASAYGKIDGASMLPKIVGIVIGAVIAKDLTGTQFHILISLSILFVFMQVFFITGIKEPSNSESYREHPWEHVVQGTREIRKAPNLLFMFTNVTVVFVSTYLFTNFEQPWVQNLGFPVAALGIVYGVGYLLSYLGSTYIGWLTKKMSDLTIMHLSGILILLSYVWTLVFDNSLVAAISAMLMVRLGRAVRWPILNNLGNQYITSKSRATTLSLLSILDSVFDVILVSMIIVMSKYGIHQIYWGCVGVALIGLLFPIRRATAADTETTETDTETANPELTETKELTI